MHSSTAIAGQVHSLPAAGEQCALHSCVGTCTLQWAGICPPSEVSLPVGGSAPYLIEVPWTHMNQPPPLPRIASGSVQPFCTVHPCAQHRDIQTTLRATSVVTIGRIYAARNLLTENVDKLILKSHIQRPRGLSFCATICMCQLLRQCCHYVTDN